MLTRRELLKRTLQGTSLIALGNAVPAFIASSARAAEAGKDKVLVVLELAGGNDGLNTVIPYADDNYQKARPKLHFTKRDVIRVDDYIGLHPALKPLDGLLQKNQLAIVQGVGYPNPNRSHFESMDIWQSADPAGKLTNGWLARSLSHVNVREGDIPAFYVGADRLPLALQGPSGSVPSLHPDQPFDVQLSGRPRGGNQNGFEVEGDEKEESDKPAPDPDAPRRRLIRELTAAGGKEAGALDFVRRTSLQTLTTVDRLKEIMHGFDRPQGEYAFSGNMVRMVREGLAYELRLISAMIRAGFGTRIYYVGMDGFDTHSEQAKPHRELLQYMADAVQTFFQELEASGDASRVLLMTFSEFGRRVHENGSQGTDHGSGSCMFVIGPGAKGGLIGKHPSLKPADLDDGDLKYHTDFRRVYATLLDRWLNVESRQVLGSPFEHVALLK